MKKLVLHRTNIEQNCHYIDTDHGIMNEDYKKVYTLFGIFSVTRTFKGRATIKKNIVQNNKNVVVKGLVKDNGHS